MSRFGLRTRSGQVSGIIQGAQAIDGDAVAFLQATGITDGTISNAIAALVNDLKNYGIWSKMIAIYPFVGGTATTHKFNLKDPQDTDGAFRLTFFGGVTHASTGVVGNGTNGYYNTHLRNITHLPQDDVSVGAYIRNNIARNEIVIGYAISSVINGAWFNPRNASDDYTSRLNNTSTTSLSNTDSRGFYVLSRNNSSNYQYSKNTTINTATQASETYPTLLYYGLARNRGDSTDDLHSEKEQAFAFFGNALTNQNITDYYNIVQTFQTSLSR